MSPEKTKPPAGKPAAAAARPAQEPALKCPRCDSPNTKFCYYNNYSLSQPRHFCKTCRRYWTRGGALRNVPIGGGCRKNKKIKSSPRLSSGDDSGDSAGAGGLKFFQGISPAMDFQLINNFATRMQYPTTQNAAVLFNQISSSFGDMSSNPISLSPCFGLDPSPATTANFNFPINNNSNNNLGFQEPGSSSFQHLATSIESLSSMNQDLHWKLQQQRLAMMFVGENQDKVEKPQPILFQNLDNNSKGEEEMMNNVQRKECGNGGNLSTEWFFDNSNYGTNVNPTPASSSSNVVNENSGNNWSTGIQAWNDINHYTSLP